MATDKPRFSVTFTEDSFAKIQKYQKDNNISTQSKAVARLVEAAIREIESARSAKKSPCTAEATQESQKAPLYSSEAMELARDYDGLDSFGKKAVRAVADVEKARCAERTQPTPKTKLYIAARDGSRIEAEIEGDITLPEHDTELPE